MIKFIFLIFFSISLVCNADIWLNNSDSKIKNDIKFLENICGIHANLYLSLPVPKSKVISYLDMVIQNSDVSECVATATIFKKAMIKEIYLNKTSIGIQSKANKHILQDINQRWYENNIIFLRNNGVSGNISYQLNIIKDIDNNKEYFDESYISYLYKNQIVTLGKQSYWWSPSKETSLILSNSSRPQLGISVSNNRPFNINKFFLKYLGDINYDVFIKKLERNREIPNALLFGNRININPNKDLTISLLRIAQFGGKGRTTNTKSLKNMILGKDTTNSELSFYEQPGNQIAGIDITYSPYNNIRLYAQYIGEDGLDPIIDDRWIGAIFPSKRFGLGGISLSNFNKKNLPYTIYLEHANTDSGFKNVTYNHSLYKSGLRYYDRPIGAHIDADSHISSIIYESTIESKSYIKLKFSKVSINQNSSQNNVWSSQPLYFNEFSATYKINFRKFQITNEFIFRDISIQAIDKSGFYTRIEYFY